MLPRASLLRLARPALAALALATAAAAASATITVRPGDTLWALARQHGTTVTALKALNGLRTDRLVPGQTLKVAAATPTRPPGAAPERASLPADDRLVWPLSGRITSAFGGGLVVRRTGARSHGGLDIAAPFGTPIVAAAGGRVSRAGWDTSGYGLLTIVRGTDGRDYFYAHTSRLLVRAGQTVARGQRIALVGSTGRSTGPHLHLEVRAGRVAVNPLALLPAGGAGRVVRASAGRR